MRSSVIVLSLLRNVEVLLDSFFAILDVIDLCLHILLFYRLSLHPRVHLVHLVPFGVQFALQVVFSLHLLLEVELDLCQVVGGVVPPRRRLMDLLVDLLDLHRVCLDVGLVALQFIRIGILFIREAFNIALMLLNFEITLHLELL